MRFRFTTLILMTLRLIYKVLPRAVKSHTALANAFNASWVVYLSMEHELEIGTGLQYIILNPFWYTLFWDLGLSISSLPGYLVNLSHNCLSGMKHGLILWLCFRSSRWSLNYLVMSKLECWAGLMRSVLT